MQIPSADIQTGRESYEVYAVKMAAKYQLDSGVFVAMLKQESGLQQYKNGAILRGSAGEIGIGQIKPATAADLGIDPYDPYENIEGAAKYLRQQLDATGGEYYGALAAYNQGLAGSRGAGRQKGLQYAEKVMQGASNAQPYTPNWFENIVSEDGALRSGLFSSIAQNAGIVVVGVGILIVAIVMTGRGVAVDTVRKALK